MPRNPSIEFFFVRRILQESISSSSSSSTTSNSSSSTTSNSSSSTEGTALGASSSSSYDSSDKSDLTPSLMIIALIFVCVFIASATIHLFLRFIARLCKSSHHHDEEQEGIDNNAAAATLEPVHHANRISSRRVVPEENRKLIDSLPLFSFDSITGLKSEASADCAVCLSRFEKQDQLRLLPICCHAFHSQCIDTWLSSNNTCPLCRSTIVVAESEDYLKLFSPSSGRRSTSTGTAGVDSFRIEIGSVSRRRNPLESDDDNRVQNHHPRSYSMGSFDYFVEEESAEVVMEPPMTHRRGSSECVLGAKKEDSSESMVTDHRRIEPPGAEIAGEVAGSRGGGGNWLRDYVDKLGRSSSSSSFSSRARSFRFSGRFFAGSGRQSEGMSRSGRRSVDVVAGDGSWDLEGNRYGEEISNFFRWLSGV